MVFVRPTGSIRLALSRVFFSPRFLNGMVFTALKVSAENCAWVREWVHELVSEWVYLCHIWRCMGVCMSRISIVRSEKYAGIISMSHQYPISWHGLKTTSELFLSQAPLLQKWYVSVVSVNKKYVLRWGKASFHFWSVRCKKKTMIFFSKSIGAAGKYCSASRLGGKIKIRNSFGGRLLPQYSFYFCEAVIPQKDFFLLTQWARTFFELKLIRLYF